MNSLENHTEMFSCNLGCFGILGKDAAVVGWIGVDTTVFVSMHKK